MIGAHPHPLNSFRPSSAKDPPNFILALRTELSSSPGQLPRYDSHRTYQWNYDHAPGPASPSAVVSVPGSFRFCGRDVDSPLGVAAGPLLNGKWCLYYAGLGFDVLTYKTVRTRFRECYELPNLLPVAADQMTGEETFVRQASAMSGSWAVSFGMPSTAPDIWRRDIEATRKALPSNKLLSVSVVGTIQPDWSMEDLAEDYALAAKWAVESGADCVETNFSCPNVATCDGQLYQSADDSRLVASTVRQAIGSTPLIIKIGHLKTTAEMETLLDGIGDIAAAIAMTNSVATKVLGDDDSFWFDGQHRGICGDAIRQASMQQTKAFAEIIRQRALPVQLIGVGGIETAKHVGEYLAAGAHACHLATAVMKDPAVGLTIRSQLAAV